MKNKLKKYTSIIIAIIVLVSTIFMPISIGATPNNNTKIVKIDFKGKITPSSTENTFHETTIFKVKKAGINKLKKGKWFAYSNGGFYFQIHKISGKKIKFSFHMPNMDIKKKTASIKSNGKTATAKVRCSSGKTHTLKISISGNSIKVQEKSSCTKKLLEYRVPNYTKTITHMFRPDGWIWY